MAERLILEKWAFTARSAGYETIVPDGCRDVIIRKSIGRAPIVFVSGLDDFPRRIAVREGDSFIGLRLRPGVTVSADPGTVLAMDRADLDDMAAIRQALIACPRTTEALAALKSARGTADAARELGVSIRTFQRVVNEATGRSPAWWRRLARVRRVAAKIASIQVRQDSLVEIAVDAGFSDQAHMTRELQHWLGTTPGQLRRGGPVAEALTACGYE